jgi:hypothetical protein
LAGEVGVNPICFLGCAAQQGMPYVLPNTREKIVSTCRK